MCVLVVVMQLIGHFHVDHDDLANVCVAMELFQVKRDPSKFRPHSKVTIIRCRESVY